MSRHQVLTRLAAYFTVVWMDPAPEWRESLAGRTGVPNPPDLPPQPDFLFYRPGLMLSHFYRPRVVAELTERGRLRWARRLLRRRGADVAVLYLWHPQFARVLDLVPHRVSCYHIVDEYSFSTVEQPVSPDESALIRRADQVIIHSSGLWEKKAPMATRAALVPNGVDFNAFASPTAEPPDMREIPHPRLGYIGVIKSVLDVPLLLALAERHRNCSFVLVGPTRLFGEDAEPFAALRRRPNVYVLGSRHVSELPAYTQHMDVGLMPYAVNHYTQHIYPLKLHEYLAAGLPLIGTPIRTLLDFTHVVRLATGVDAWSNAIEAALAPDARNADAIASRQTVAREHDWGVLVRRIAMLLAERLGEPWPERVAATQPAAP
jgi:glycosyltransferase involved in cell wall biosynthesis